MASIRRRGDTWQARIVQKGFTPITKSFPSRELAELWAKKTEVDMARGAFIDTQLAERTTLGEVFKRYTLEVSPLHRGQKHEVARLSLLGRDKVATIALANLTPQDIADLRDRRLQRIKESTCNREMQLVSAVISHACREWGMHLPRGNPCALVRKPPPGLGRRRLFEGDEETRLYAAIRGEGYQRVPREKANWWLEPIVTLAIETAMRRGELLAMQWRNVDLGRRVVYLPVTKNGHPRAVPLSSRAVTTFKELPRAIDGGTVFPVAWTAVHQAWRKACKRAGIDGLRFHDLRHVGTCRLAERLPNVIELASVTGHRDVKMLARYYHVPAEVLAAKLA